MKRSLKVLVSVICLCAMFISISAPVLAESNYTSNRANINLNDEDLVKMLVNMGLTDEEVSYIMKLEYERRQSESDKIALNAFPRDPYVGQWHTETYRIHFTSANMGVTGILALLLSGNVPLSVGVVIAGVIANEYAERADARGAWITIDYLYGETNDGYLGWITGPADWGLFY